MMKVLVLGGTQFIGRNLVNELKKNKDYEITLFNRQITSQNIFPKLNKIKGDRETSEINKIASGNWDYVIDLSCYYPAALSETIKNLNHSLKKYIFISTCSVYEDADTEEVPRIENSKILSCSPAQAVDRSTDSYGQRKVECERIISESGIDYVILRPALVYGPYDHTDRFYYWLYQLKTNNDILIPENGERLLSLTYVQDLVKVIIAMLSEDNMDSIYNVISETQISIMEILNIASKLMNIKPNLISANANFLKENEIKEWFDMPLWINNDISIYDNKRLLEIKHLRPDRKSTSFAATIDYYQNLGWPTPIYGITESQRIDLLTKLN